MAHATTEQTKRGWTKARAVLAGGLVLGVGAAITLAAWTDTEWATGTFAAGNFGIEGSTNGTTFTENPTSGPAASLSFQVNADKLSPGDSVYAGFAVQLIESSDYAASVDLAQNPTPSLPVGVTASHKLTTSATCNEAAFDGSVNSSTSFTLSAVEAPQYICFEVTADSDLEQGSSGSVSWTFTATSTTVL